MALWKQILLSFGLICSVAVGLVFYAPGSDLIKSLPFGEKLTALSAAHAKISDPSVSTPGAGAVRARPLPLVVLSEVEPAKLDERIRSVGTAQAIDKTVLFPEVSGRIVSVTAQAGDRLNENDVIVQLDDRVQQLAMERARLSLADAEDLVERYETLAARNTISAVQLTEATSDLEKARLDLKEAEDALQRRAIRAPFSGEIGLIDVGVGDYVTPTTPVANLDERKTLLIEFRLPERFANQVRLGQSIDLTTAALPGVELLGSVSGIDSRVDTVSRTLLVQGTLDNAMDLARPGMSFDVTLAFEGKELSAVPALAIQWDRNGSYVWKAENGQTVRSEVSIIGRQSDQVLISGELEIGDKVVTEGTASVRQGMAYRLPS